MEERHGYTLSESSLRRAEEGRASEVTLKWIAQTLGFPSARYLLTNANEDPWRPTFDLSGRWRVFYLEDDVGTEPYTAVERLFLTQIGSRLDGLYEPYGSDHPDGYVGSDAFVLEGTVAENVVIGRYHRGGATHPRGAGVCQLLVLRDGAWAEGLCTYFADDGHVMASLNIWVKEGNPEFEIMLKQVQRVLQAHGALMRFPVSTRRL